MSVAARRIPVWLRSIRTWIGLGVIIPVGMVTVCSVISDELATVQADDPARARLAGPIVMLHPRAAEALALALHELTTNALKYGALSTPVGRSTLTWWSEVREGAPVLVLDWAETGVRLDPKEDRRIGFGRVVLEELLAYQLEAEAQLGFSPDGLTCRIVLPFTERIVPGGGRVCIQLRQRVPGSECPLRG